MSESSSFDSAPKESYMEKEVGSHTIETDALARDWDQIAPLPFGGGPSPPRLGKAKENTNNYRPRS